MTPRRPPRSAPSCSAAARSRPRSSNGPRAPAGRSCRRTACPRWAPASLRCRSRRRRMRPDRRAGRSPGCRCDRRSGAGRRGGDRRRRAVADLGLPRRAAGPRRRTGADRRPRQARRSRPARGRRPPHGPDRAGRREHRSRRGRGGARAAPGGGGGRASWGARTTPGATCRWRRSCSGRGRPTLATPASPPTPASRLAGFKVPTAWTRLDVLPRTASGKLRRDAVRALLAGEASGELARPDGDAIGWRVDGSGPRPSSCSTGR